MENLEHGTPAETMVTQGISMEQEIRTFLAEIFIVDQDIMALPGNASLTDHGILDSMGVLELVLHLEESYGIHISETETTPDNLDTIDNAVRFVRSKLGAITHGDPDSA